MRHGVFAGILRDAGRIVEEHGDYGLYERFSDGAVSKARGGGNSTGRTNAGKGINIMIFLDARGVPVAIENMSASPQDRQLVQWLVDFMLASATVERIIADKAYDSDDLAAGLCAQGMELIGPHRSNRNNVIQEGRPP